MDGSSGTWLHRLLRSVLAWIDAPRAASKRKRKTIPSFEPLEAVALMSAGSHLASAALGHNVRSALVHRGHTAGHRQVGVLAKHHQVSSIENISFSDVPVTSPAQSVSLGSTTTNFTGQPLAPALNLFNPSLGRLESVTVGHSANVQSNITSTNLSPTSSTVITATMTGSFEIDGLNQPISQPTQMLSSAPDAGRSARLGYRNRRFPAVGDLG